MQRITLFSVAAVLLLTGTASAALTVYEYVPGEKVTLDSGTGKYWYWNLADFVDMPYSFQITAIGGISPTYGNIAGGWHMASLSEMQALWTYTETDITSAFGVPSVDWPGWFIGRYESVPEPGAHYYAGSHIGGEHSPPLSFTWSSLNQTGHWTWDFDPGPALGSWVTTDATVIPAPPEIVMATTGLLCLIGAKLRCRWRRR